MDYTLSGLGCLIGRVGFSGTRLPGDKAEAKCRRGYNEGLKHLFPPLFVMPFGNILP